MSRPGRQVVRGHLKLASARPPASPAPSRAALRLRALAARLRILWLDLVALAGAFLALLPLLVRRRPLGHRTQVPRRPAPRVIPLPPRRRARP